MRRMRKNTTLTQKYPYLPYFPLFRLQPQYRYPNPFQKQFRYPMYLDLTHLLHRLLPLFLSLQPDPHLHLNPPSSRCLSDGVLGSGTHHPGWRLGLVRRNTAMWSRWSKWSRMWGGTCGEERGREVVTQYGYCTSQTLLVSSQNTWDRCIRSLRTPPSLVNYISHVCIINSLLSQSSLIYQT